MGTPLVELIETVCPSCSYRKGIKLRTRQHEIVIEISDTMACSYTKCLRCGEIDEVILVPLIQMPETD